MALNTRIGPTAVAAALGLAALASAGSAHAVACSSLAQDWDPDYVIYGSGGSAITPTLARVAYVLSKATPPIHVFYQDGGGAGAGYQSFSAGNGGTTSRPFRYWVTEADVTGTSPTCTADDAAAGRAVDFATTGGTLGLFDGLSLAADTGVFIGPTQGVNVIVPKASTEASISTEALFFVYGFGDATQLSGAGNNVIPWTTKQHIFRRASTAFVQQFLRGAIRTLGGSADTIPADFPAATASSPDTNQGTVDNVAAAASAGFAQETIGFTSGPTAEKNRATVHTLAYQHTGQDAAYWPDSTADAFDKINIRNGHYFLWDTNQFFTKITGSNKRPALSQIVKPGVRAFIGYFSGQLASPEVPAEVGGHDAVTEAIIKTGSIPLCAMQVQRETDFGGLSCYAPANPCGHYFDYIATKAPTGDACSKDSECEGSEPKCRFNFCEAY